MPGEVSSTPAWTCISGDPPARAEHDTNEGITSTTPNASHGELRISASAMNWVPMRFRISANNETPGRIE